MLRLAVAYCNWHAGFFFFFVKIKSSRCHSMLSERSHAVLGLWREAFNFKN